MICWPKSSWIAVTLVAIAAPTASGQIIEMRERRGEQIMCALSGLIRTVWSCGLDDKWNESILVGSILGIDPGPKDEMHVRIKPVEIFKGPMSDEFDVVTSQGNCLPELRIGDRWLFTLRRDEQTHELVIAYGDSEYPVGEAVKQIDLLRQLVAMDSAGIIRGSASKEDNTPE